uniref:RING-type domain-containing protein n=1 Tax=Araucaria cunninghamii TaxID=56994 RepID=A0A0D6R5Y2_ARACU
METSRRYGLPFSLAGAIQSPLSSLLEFSGLSRGRQSQGDVSGGPILRGHGRVDDVSGRARVDNGGGAAEVSIRIFGGGEPEHVRVGTVHGYGSDDGQEFEPATSSFSSSLQSLQSNGGDAALSSMPTLTISAETAADVADGRDRDENVSSSRGNGDNSIGSGSHRYDIQQLARWTEQVLPFSLLLLVIFVRQHFQGFFVSFWITAATIKLNDLVRKQTSLKAERKISVLVGIILVLLLHVAGIYWCYKDADLWHPLLMLPPKAIPPFWHAIFVIVVNDTMVRQAAMILKCVLLGYYKSNRNCNYRKQGQMLTVVEYILLLYRALLPIPVWYRFFLNKEYGSLFSSLTTGLYLTFKLTSIVEKVQASYTAVKALLHKEVQYGSYATAEEVVAAGDLCAICQEKMHAPILLRCKHIFCEDCVSEWFERERTCPLCRAVVKQAELISFGDGSTSLFFQLF